MSSAKGFMRQAVQTDAPALAQLLQATGLDDNPDPEWIARVILETNHATLVEQDGNHLTGFVDSFTTGASDGRLRWEIDLLGVHPDYRGRGIAQELVRASVESGRQMGASLARALVRTDNRASLNTFMRCGFTLLDETHDLYISSSASSARLSAPPGSHLISVCTLTYSGVWVEGRLSPEALRCAQSARARFGWDVAGGVIPAGGLAAEEAGYEWAGQYRWLRIEY
jgi:ribosomal protein S18 acetylase RimI-like enzyme